MGSRDMFGISISLGSGERYLSELEKAGMVGYTDIWAPRNLSHVMNWGKYLTRWNIDDENECQVFLCTDDSESADGCVPAVSLYSLDNQVNKESSRRTFAKIFREVYSRGNVIVCIVVEFFCDTATGCYIWKGAPLSQNDSVDVEKLLKFCCDEYLGKGVVLKPLGAFYHLHQKKHGRFGRVPHFHLLFERVT